MEIYDWLLFPPPGPEIIYDNQPDERGQTQDIGPAMNATRATMPKELYESSSQLQPLKTLKPTPPSVPTPGNQPAARKVGMEEIMAAADQTRIPTAAADIHADSGSKEQEAGVKKQESRSAPSLEKKESEELGPGVSLGVVLPNYKKSVPPATITAESLAAKMAKARNDTESNPDSRADKSARYGAGAEEHGTQPPATTVNYIQQKSEARSKAEQYLQQEIDRKLRGLEEKTKRNDKIDPSTSSGQA